MKYNIGDEVTTKKEFSVFGSDAETGREFEHVIPAGASGEIESTGWSSYYEFKSQYWTTFKLGDDEVEVMFFESDLEELCEIKRHDLPDESQVYGNDCINGSCDV